MPSKIQSGDTVMGRWPGSTLYYEVKVLSYDTETELYTVIYKDGTELELKDSDIKNHTAFRQVSGRSRSRSRSPSRRRSRSRSPARTSRRSPSRTSSRTNEGRKDKLKEVLEVRLTPVVLPPTENNSNNKHEQKQETIEPKVEPEQQRSRYNLRRRKDGDPKPTEEVKVEKEPTASPCPTLKTTELEFGGRIGTFIMLLFLPSVVLHLLLQVSQDDGSLLTLPASVPTAEALWDWQVFGLVLLWLCFQAVLCMLPLGKVVDGMPLKTGKKLKYRINGFLALLISAVAVGVALQQEVDLTYIHTHFLQFFSSAVMISVLLSVYLYTRSRHLSEEEQAPSGNSGYLFHDFFMGRELNPRIRSFDVKFFCEMRPGLIGWLLINFSMLLAEMKVQKLDSPSPAMWLVTIFQFLWVADGLWHEEKLLTTMDIVHDGFGFMLAFGDLVWVPFTFTCQAHYLVSHPSELSMLFIAVIITIKGIGYFVFRKANSQKNNFRKNPSDPSHSHLKTISTATGKSLIVSGLWGFVRHPNYLGDLLMGLAWSLPCGFVHAAPYFYLIYLVLLLIHRNSRDEHQCRKKYGSAWDEYCKAVPYRFFPRIY
ncbi:delta(14)-sterol reductase LBR [Clupea harengus]|uniref:Delta(14)-sterol reductase LBR n=1 Tax=Clupea harengus TaxID=7950 RepID=A0A6P8GPI1_CLUHA|nr:delta(14)-sterol reductase LBR [Clupea harengus]